MITPLNISCPQDLKKLDYNELKEFASQVRFFLMDNISRTGGHIGANLGTVDLTVSLHYVFNSPVDKIIFDTGHQGYTHKIITGRAGMFPTLNTYGGMGRFVARSESSHDIIDASHAGTSISIGLAMALAKKLKKDKSYVISVIGDGSLCEGLALEALNHASVEKDINFIIVLNDNGFAISPGFGALHNYLQSRHKADLQETLFTSLGYDYIGPVDGHSIDALIDSFEKAKTSQKIPLVHVKTIKGYGFKITETHPLGMHFSFPFNSVTGQPINQPQTNYQDVAAKVIMEEMSLDEKIVAITPSTIYATGLQPVFNRFPDRTFDPGMEEQHAMAMTAGFCLEGHKPVIFYQSTFMQRAFDQLIHDVCFINLPVLILTVRTGFSGYDSPTHHGIYDFSYLQGVPNLKILYPKDSYELELMVREHLKNLTGPTLIGMPYGPVDNFDRKPEADISVAGPEIVCNGKDIVLITVGHKYDVAYSTIKYLTEKGIDCGLINLRCLKPLPEEELIMILSRTLRAVSLEEAILDGGIGSSIASLIADKNLKCELLRIGIPCKFVEPGSNSELCEIYGLDMKGVITKIKKRWPEL